MTLSLSRDRTGTEGWQKSIYMVGFLDFYKKTFLRGNFMKSNTFYIRPVPSLALALLILMGLTAMANAQVPDPDLCFASSANSEPVSILVRPDGGGRPLTEAMLFGGAQTDATITLTVLDGAGNPVVGYPAENFWMVIDCLPPACAGVCEAGSISDGSTNDLGQTTFSNPLRAGGTGANSTIMIDTVPLPDSPLEFPGGDLFLFNSPDISGDLVVNLSDVALFTGDYYGPYNYRSDFYWDGILNLSDIVFLAQAVGASCP